jgi:ABC-2 type transport system ATP-binding protein
MNPPNSSSAIVVDDLKMSFGDVHALRGISFEVPKGTVLGLLGPNGAGKTTAVRILTTILKPTAGRAWVNGINVADDPHAVRRNIGLAGQYAAVDEDLTGRENLVLIGSLCHVGKERARARAIELLEQFKLTDAGDRPVRTYSGGMRRRLDLAAALITHPPVLLLDEPTTGLDPASRNDLWAVIEGLVDDGTTVLLTTQYLEEADRLANNIVVINQGQIAAQGTAAELKQRIGETMLALSTSGEAMANAALAALATVAPATSKHGSEIHVPLRGGADAVREILNVLEAANIEIGRIDIHEPTLDDVFLSITGGVA